MKAMMDKYAMLKKYMLRAANSDDAIRDEFEVRLPKQ
jgi:hypothetical protein